MEHCVPTGASAGPIHDQEQHVHDPEPAMRAVQLDPRSTWRFVVNAASGAVGLDAKRQVIESALADAGRRGELIVARPAELARVAADAARRAAAEHAALVAVGGDGSLNTVAQAAHEAGCVMGVVPYGTFNYFARTHRVPTDPAAAVRLALEGVPQPVQVAAVNGHLFLVNASVGLYPDLLEDREAYKRRFGRSRWVAIYAAVATLMRAQQHLRLHIELGAGERDVDALTLFVGNNRLQLDQLGAQPDDTLPGTPGAGSIAAVMLRPVGTFTMLRLLMHGAMGTLGEAGGVERFEFHHMVVQLGGLHAGRTVKVAFDGEVTRLAPPLDFRVLDEPLYLLQPRDEALDRPAATGASA
ncbi:MAG: diacylglycerol kinase [Ideonella sp.]|nr:diacylglycerol kinase [Ideonella sp.]